MGFSICFQLQQFENGNKPEMNQDQKQNANEYLEKNLEGFSGIDSTSSMFPASNS